MFDFLGQIKLAPSPYAALLNELAAAADEHGYITFREHPARPKILALPPEEQQGFVLAALDWLDHHRERAKFGQFWRVHDAMLETLRRKPALDEAFILRVLDWSIRQSSNFSRGMGAVVKVLERFVDANPLNEPILKKVEELVGQIETEPGTADSRMWVMRLQNMLPQPEITIPIEPGEAWSDAAICDLRKMSQSEQTAWARLLNFCLNAAGAVPSQKWLKAGQELVQAIGATDFQAALLRWFPLVDQPRTRPLPHQYAWSPDPNLTIDASNADLLKGLAWLCSLEENAEIARKLTELAKSAYRKVPHVGPRCVRLGNACAWALGNMPGMQGVEALLLLKARVKASQAQRAIDAALNAAAKRLELPAEEIEEMSAPTYGLDEVGMRREEFGDVTATLRVTGTNTTEMRWLRSDGKRLSSAPKSVKEQYPDELKEISAAEKDIRRMLPAIRSRIEAMYLAQKQWRLPIWRERYLDHPLVGVLARRLIWKFTRGDQAGSGVWHEGQIVGKDGRALNWLDDQTSVELWHPISAGPASVLGWREWLAEHEIQQPFKQAHREVYLLTDAETQTASYSNRFAAHILKQHQFHALCAERGWKNKLRLMVDATYPPPSRSIPAYNLRAEFWVEGIGGDYRTDLADSGAFLYISTDQVRFYPISAAEHHAHAGGGGYSAGYRMPPQEALPLEAIPPLVFSEILRDIDLFVGVCSVGNDANWSDGGPEGRFRDYWMGYSFGSLSETANTRRQVLEKILPRLKIAAQCSLTERFLVVRGELHTYKIHLGSGNILMEPTDQYLCIVQRPGVSNSSEREKLFLPFEGDGVLAVILSKAFLLAKDLSITDPTILRQIK